MENNLMSLAFERQITVVKDGVRSEEKLMIGNIKMIGDTWYCHWTFGRLHPETGRFSGVDPLAALIRTVDFLASFIHESESDGYEIYWQFPDDHGGFKNRK